MKQSCLLDGCLGGSLFTATLAIFLHLAPETGFAQTNRLGPPPPLEREGAERQSQLGSRGIRTHDPSTIVKCKDEYWLFCTGRGVQSYHSKDLLKWDSGPNVFSNAPSWAADAVPANRNMHYWAPDIIHLRDHYLLYYSVSSFGKSTLAIGLATNPTLDPAAPEFQWTDQGIVVQTTGNSNYNAIDPAVFHDTDGKLWLSFGSFWSGIKLIQLDPATGKRIAPDSPMVSLAHNDAVEASCLFRHEDHYYLFVNWGICCRGANSTYEIRVGRSDNVTGPYVDKEGRDMLTDGGTKFLQTEGAFIGPGHAGILAEGDKYWFSFHFYNGLQRGTPTLAIVPLQWTSDGWPRMETKRKE